MMVLGLNNWGHYSILLASSGESIGPTGDVSPVVGVLKNAMFHLKPKA